ncbi:hypothetical protein L9F63_021305, partial [Diploptera punctata]
KEMCFGQKPPLVMREETSVPDPEKKTDNSHNTVGTNKYFILSFSLQHPTIVNDHYGVPPALFPRFCEKPSSENVAFCLYMGLLYYLKTLSESSLSL